MAQTTVEPAAGSCVAECEPCTECCECEASATNELATAARLRRWAWWLTALTIGWNSIEALVSVVSGWLAGSIALVGFGLDSIVEVTSALVIVWRLSQQSDDDDANEQAEQVAVRLIALSFLAIAAYVTFDAVRKLAGIGEPPEQSVAGLAIVTLSLVVMPVLVWAKRRVAAGLGSVALKADAGETQVCIYLSAIVLMGLAANGLFGWWWMDPIAGLAVAALAAREGYITWVSGDLCQDDARGVGPVGRFLCAQLCCPACPVPATPV
jgi:divalent metal cation (Fe/Co/Zn/Cd) transporter